MTDEKKVERIDYEDGSYYTGEVKDGEPHGHGKLVRLDVFEYIGNFCDGTFSGEGKITYPDGSVYEGEFHEDVRHGWGTFTSVKGKVYEGDWVADKRHGLGKLTADDGRSYEGEWENDRPHGQGWRTEADGTKQGGTWERGDLVEEFDYRNITKNEILYTDGDIEKFVEEIVDNIPTGKGKLFYRNRNVYEGEVKDGKPNGYGKMIYDRYGVYEGNFVDGQRHGFGKYTWQGGDQWYQGNFVNGQKHGTGIIRWGDGEIFNGEFVDDQQHFGELELPNGDVYKGEMSNRAIHGTGEMTYANGDVYVGSWRWNQRQGVGELTLSCGEVQKGLFLKHVFKFSLGYTGDEIDGKPHGHGILVYDNGDIYEGDFENGIPHGKGKKEFFEHKDIDYYDGDWVNGSMTGSGKINYRSKYAGTYTGEVKDGLPHGQGRLDYTDTMYYGYDVGDIDFDEKKTGRWENGKFVE
jgi:hypothetical protein